MTDGGAQGGRQTSIFWFHNDPYARCRGHENSGSFAAPRLHPGTQKNDGRLLGGRAFSRLVCRKAYATFWEVCRGESH